MSAPPPAGPGMIGARIEGPILVSILQPILGPILGARGRRCLARALATLTILLALLGLAGAAGAGCGAPGPDPCRLPGPGPGGTYHLERPAGAAGMAGAGGAPAVIFLHGYGGSGAGVLARRAMVETLTAGGFAVLAPDALPRPGGDRAVWNFYPGWPGRDDMDFLEALREAAARRFRLDPRRMVLAGFSAGGFMVNYLACARPGAFAAYAPVGGGFWQPLPARCAGPVRLMHSHGWADQVVPLEGRPLRGGRYRQGDIFAGLALWRATNGCGDARPEIRPETRPERAQPGSGAAGPWRRVWTGCAPGSALQLRLYPDGHVVPEDWAAALMGWLGEFDRAGE